MNNDFIPIIGESDGTRFVINIISYTTGQLITRYGDTSISTSLTPYKCFRLVFNLVNKIPIINFLYNDKIYIISVNYSFATFKVVNCDCQFVPDAGLINTVDTSVMTPIFHIGDQIYLDLIFIKYAKNNIIDDDIIKGVYEEYKVAFLRKINILQGGFNIMLGDDHEIADETVRSKYAINITSKLIKLFKRVFNDIQMGLRLSTDILIHYNDSFILVDNIRDYSDIKYAKYIYDLVKQSITLGTMKKRLFILSTRVPMNNKISCITNMIYGKQQNDINYLPFYDMLTSLLDTKVFILCGDEHTVKSFKVTTKYGSCQVLFVGPLNSPVDPYDSQDYVQGAQTEQLYSLQVNGYITANPNINHVTINPACCSYGTYITKYLLARFCC